MKGLAGAITVARLVIIVLVIGLTFVMAGCGEKPCNSAGSIKNERGTIYHCIDRGGGLRWYPE